MDCFDNYIGLRGYCSDQTPESGMWINDLSGIDLKMMSNILDADGKDYKTFWEQMYARTLNELQSDVLVKAQEYFNTNILLQNAITSYYTDPYETVNSSNEYKGSTIEIDYNTSKYLSVFVNHVQLYLNSSANGNIYIYNMMNGMLLDTVSFEGTEGSNIIQINKNYNTYGQETKIFVCYDGSVSGSIKSDMWDLDDLASVRGAKIAKTGTPLTSNLTYDGDSYGLIVNFNLKCDISEFICTSKDLFKMALYYKLGANIQFERLTSNRLNKYTIQKTKEEIKDLWQEYQDKYDANLAATLNNLDMNNDNICFSCNKRRNYKYLRP